MADTDHRHRAGHRSAHAAARRAAPRRADLADGRRWPSASWRSSCSPAGRSRRRDRRPTPATPAAGAESRPAARLSGPPARARRAQPSAGAQPDPRRPRGAACSTRTPARRPDGSRSQEDDERREYESLFASNVVISRRPDGQQPLVDGDRIARDAAPSVVDAPSPAPPSLDDVAEAVVRATARSRASRPAPNDGRRGAASKRSAARPTTARPRPGPHRTRFKPPARCIGCSRARSSTPC